MLGHNVLRDDFKQNSRVDRDGRAPVEHDQGSASIEQIRIRCGDGVRQQVQVFNRVSAPQYE